MTDEQWEELKPFAEADAVGVKSTVPTPRFYPSRHHIPVMGIYTNAVKGLHRAPYRSQVLVHLVNHGIETLSPKEEAKIERVQRFLPAFDCAREIAEARTGR